MAPAKGGTPMVPGDLFASSRPVRANMDATHIDGVMFRSQNFFAGAFSPGI
jgi:hypothetical protein